MSVRLHPDSGSISHGRLSADGQPLTVSASTTNNVSQSHVRSGSTYDAHLPENAEKLLRTDEDNILNVIRWALNV